MEPQNDVVCAGILVADHVCTPMAALPSAGQLVAVDRMFLLTGGCAANVAVNLAKQGLQVGVAGRVGNDYWGRFVREDLAGRGLDTRGILVSEDSQTSQTMILLCKGEDRRFVHTFGANADMRVSDIDRHSLPGTRVFYVGGYLVMPRFEAEELADLFRFCREHGVRTVLDVVIPTGFRYGGELEGVLAYTDVFLPNNDEAEMLTGEAEPARQAEVLHQRGAGTVVVTMGGEGMVYTGEDGRIWRAAHFPSEVVDQSGAGDAFCAGFIAGMVRGVSLEECLQYGSALGASCGRSMGCYEGVFTGTQAEDFLRENRLAVQPLA